MTDQDITELAAILVNEHGHSALRIARARRDQHRHEPHSTAYQLWDEIQRAVEDLLLETASAEPSRH